MMLSQKIPVYRLEELKKKLGEKAYMQTAILEIAVLLTESIHRGHFLLHERK